MSAYKKNRYKKPFPGKRGHTPTQRAGKVQNVYIDYEALPKELDEDGMAELGSTRMRNLYLVSSRSWIAVSICLRSAVRVL